MTIRIETAPTPDLVRQALRDTAAGIEPHRTLVRRACARLHRLGARQSTSLQGADP